MPEEKVKELEEIAKEKHADRATVVREMIITDIEGYKLKKAARRYREGKASIEEAAKQAEVSTWEMIEYIKKKNIRPPAQNLEELKKEHEEAME